MSSITGNKVPIKIAFILPSLRPGGAERVMSYIASNLDIKKFATRLLIIGFEEDKAYDTKIAEVIYFNKHRVSKAIFPLFKHLLAYKYDIVISSISHVNILIGLYKPFFPQTFFIGREASVISVFNEFNQSKPSIFQRILKPAGKVLYRNLDCIISQSEDMADDLVNYFKISPEKVFIINNPITNDIQLKDRVTYPNKRIYYFITVGRLSPEKGHLRILSLLSKFHKPFHYTIIGDGNQKEAIYNSIESLGLKDKVTHIPFTKQVNEYLRKSDVFIQGSYVEGFPNAVLESCTVGTPVIAYQAPGGTREIIKNSINGYIVNNENEFIEKLEVICETDWDPEKVSTSVYEQFNSKIILDKYERLFLQNS